MMFCVFFLSFMVTRSIPYPPFLYIIDPITTFKSEMFSLYGLNKPVIEQFFIYIGNLFRGDWGVSISISLGTPVLSLIKPYFARTLELTIFSVFFSSLIGIKAGIASTVNRNKWKDKLLRGISLLGVSIPVFWLGILLQYLFGYNSYNVGLNILPVSGYKTSGIGNSPFITGLRTVDSLLTGNLVMFIDAVLHLILPVFCLSFVSLAAITRQTRSSILDTLEYDYVLTARAKGCKEKDIIKHHTLRNALVPTVNFIGMNFGALLVGVVLIEKTFNIYGIGILMIRAIISCDYFVINVCVFLMVFLFIIMKFITNLISAIIDPRIRY